MKINLIEETIEKLESIVACRIIVDEEGNFDEIHIVANGTRTAKQLVRDIQSVLVATYNIKMDHKKISIAEIHDQRLKRSQFRLKIVAISQENNANKSTIRVVLESNERVFENSIVGINTNRNLDRMLVDATLRTVEEAYGYKEIFVLEDIKVIDISDEKVVVVIVTHVDLGLEQKLCGSSIVKSEHMEAVVKATLNALNRYTTE